MIHSLYQWTLAWAATPQAEWALFLIAIAESVFFPLPPDILLMAMAVANPSGSFFFALLCTLGSLIGAVLGYLLGKYGGQPLMHRFIKQDTVLKVEQLFNRYDAWAIAIAGFTPIPYKVFTVASGAFNINFKTFMLASILGRAGRFFMVAGLFYFWGADIKNYIERYFNLFSVIFVGLLIGGLLVLRLLKVRNHKDSGDNAADNSTLAV